MTVKLSFKTPCDEGVFLLLFNYQINPCYILMNCYFC